MKGLILLVYFNRPNLVHNALESIRQLKYLNYEVAAIDDGSDIPLKDIIEEHYYDIAPKFTHYQIKDSEAVKVSQGGSLQGKWLNIAMQNSDADFAVILCDDDALQPKYFKKAEEWLKSNPDEVYGYCHVVEFNPLTELPIPKACAPSGLNYTKALNGRCMLDASQVLWRLAPVKRDGIAFPYPMTTALDADFYQQMYLKYGPCKFMWVVGQWKGVFPGQLGKREHFFKGTEG